MAVAGTSLEAFNLILVGNRIINQGSGRIAGHLVEKDPAKAVAEFRRRKNVHLWKYGNNLAEFRRLFAESLPHDVDGKGAVK